MARVPLSAIRPASGARNPSTSVFVPIQRPSRATSVLTAPTRVASGSISSSFSRIATLNGAVMLAPRTLAWRANAAKSSASAASIGT